jgi:hypothetical protein
MRHDHGFHARIEMHEQAALGQEIAGNVELRRKRLFFFGHPSALADSADVFQSVWFV